jgi:histone H4
MFKRVRPLSSCLRPLSIPPPHTIIGSRLGEQMLGHTLEDIVAREEASIIMSCPPGTKLFPGKKRYRHKRVLRDNIFETMTKPAIRRLARRGGVKRISGGMYNEIRASLKVFLEDVLRVAVWYTTHDRCVTLSAMDIVRALKRQGRTLYGYGG